MAPKITVSPTGTLALDAAQTAALGLKPGDTVAVVRDGATLRLGVAEEPAAFRAETGTQKERALAALDRLYDQYEETFRELAK